MTLPSSGPTAFPHLPDIAGVELRAHAAGLRYAGRPDLFAATFASPASVAGVLTKSACPSAAVEWCRTQLARGTSRGVVVNAGNANAFTGRAGEMSNAAMAAVVADAIDAAPSDVFVASTGVIGEPIDDDAMGDGLRSLMASSACGWADAASAICTTDTFPKGASRPVATAGATGVITGIAKGSGMIAPNMATMLAFVFTDLAVSADGLDRALRPAIDRSFNSITVDSDTSTSDTVLVFATGAAGNDPIDGPTHPDWPAFARALEGVCTDLAHLIVRDGEGATKFVAITVTGAADDVSAKTIALAVANSPLVKTALAAEDANWGRFIAAVGKAGEPADRDRLRLSIGDVLVAADGEVAPGYVEADATTVLKQDAYTVTIDVGVGSGSSTVWTCDLTHGYIDINAGYRS